MPSPPDETKQKDNSAGYNMWTLPSELWPDTELDLLDSDELDDLIRNLPPRLAGDPEARAALAEQPHPDVMRRPL